MLNSKPAKLAVYAIAAIAVLLVPILLQATGSNSWVRIVDIALLYVLLALGLNIVVGYAGLLDLGFIAFFAVGSYLYSLLASPHLTETFAFIATHFPNGLHMNFWLVMVFAAFVAGVTGLILGAPVLKLRGDTWPSSPWALARSCASSCSTSTARSTSPTAPKASAAWTRFPSSDTT